MIAKEFSSYFKFKKFLDALNQILIFILCFLPSTFLGYLSNFQVFEALSAFLNIFLEQLVTNPFLAGIKMTVGIIVFSSIALIGSVMGLFIRGLHEVLQELFSPIQALASLVFLPIGYWIFSNHKDAALLNKSRLLRSWLLNSRQQLTAEEFQALEQWIKSNQIEASTTSGQIEIDQAIIIRAILMHPDDSLRNAIIKILPKDSMLFEELEKNSATSGQHPLTTDQCLLWIAAKKSAPLFEMRNNQLILKQEYKSKIANNTLADLSESEHLISLLNKSRPFYSK